MKHPDRYLYPAVFTYEDDGDISITVHDLPGCVSVASSDEEALHNAREAMGGHLWCMEQDGDEIPAPSTVLSVPLEKNERAVPIDVYMPALRMAKENRSINRTVTLPAWLNAAALEQGVNFSQVLQSALIERMGVHRPASRS